MFFLPCADRQYPLRTVGFIVRMARTPEKMHRYANRFLTFLIWLHTLITSRALHTHLPRTVFQAAVFSGCTSSGDFTPFGGVLKQRIYFEKLSSHQEYDKVVGRALLNDAAARKMQTNDSSTVKWKAPNRKRVFFNLMRPVIAASHILTG